VRQRGNLEARHKSVLSRSRPPAADTGGGETIRKHVRNKPP
jgi:hypothetical protein